MLKRLSLAFAVMTAVTSCAYPRTIRVYDEDCGIVAKKMVLELDKGGHFEKCADRECVGQLVANAAVLAASTVVSGSIVVAGNVVYWLEKRKDCAPKKTLPEVGPVGA